MGCPPAGTVSGRPRGCPVAQPLTWAGAGEARGSPPALADGAQRLGEAVQLILHILQGAPDGAGTVQHVDGQGVRVKLHREGALDAGGIVPGEAVGTGPWSPGGDAGALGRWGQGLRPPGDGLLHCCGARAAWTPKSPRDQLLGQDGGPRPFAKVGTGEAQAFSKQVSAGPPSLPHLLQEAFPRLCAVQSLRSALCLLVGSSLPLLPTLNTQPLGLSFSWPKTLSTNEQVGISGFASLPRCQITCRQAPSRPPGFPCWPSATPAPPLSHPVAPAV